MRSYGMTVTYTGFNRRGMWQVSPSSSILGYDNFRTLRALTLNGSIYRNKREPTLDTDTTACISLVVVEANFFNGL